jgi:hypothetical protein
MPTTTTARWIWTSNYNIDHEVYARYAIDRLSPPVNSPQLIVTVDNIYELYVDGILQGTNNDWIAAEVFNLKLAPGKHVIAIHALDAGSVAGILAELRVGSTRIGTNSAWRVSRTGPKDWQTLTFNDSLWAPATDYGAYGTGPWSWTTVANMPGDTPAHWIWSSDNLADDEIFARYTVEVSQGF